MKQFILAHATIITFGALYAFIGLVSSLPAPGDPRPFSVKLYETIYNFLHLLSNKAVEKNPNLAMVPGTSVKVDVPGTPAVPASSTTVVIGDTK